MAVSTTTEGMQKAASFLGETAAVAKHGVQTVDGGLTALKITWTGEASVAFDSAMRAWINDCKFIMGKLTEMIEVMNGNRQVIAAGEQANTQIAAKIPVGPGLSGLESNHS